VESVESQPTFRKIASIFKVEECDKEETSMKQAARETLFTSCFMSTDCLLHAPPKRRFTFNGDI
jgi:hypothetical protein